MLLCEDKESFLGSYMAGGILAFLLSDEPSSIRHLGSDCRERLREDLKDTVSKWDYKMEMPCNYK